MTYRPKSVEEAQQLYFNALADANSRLRIDKTKGSIAYTFARASAAIAVGQDADLKALADSVNLSTAVGDQLDAFSSFGITRAPANYSEGTLLCLSFTELATIAPNTLFTELATGVQVVSTNTTPVVVSYVETPVPVKAVVVGPAGNLPAGSKLYVAGYPYLVGTVGTIRNQEGEYSGSLTGGMFVESDTSLRNRIASWLLSHSTASQVIVINRLLSFPGVTKAYAYTKRGGVLEVWVDAVFRLSENQRLELLSYLKPYVSAGVVVSISQLTPVAVNFLVEVLPFQGTDLDSLGIDISQVIADYLSSLEMQQTLSVERLNVLLSGLTRIARLLEPTRDVRALHGQLLVPGEVQIKALVR